jgi:sulfatase modifying factor 1
MDKTHGTFRAVTRLLALGGALVVMADCSSRSAPWADGTMLDGVGPGEAGNDAVAQGDGASGCEHPAVVKSCSNGWCRVPPGCFWMGSPKDEPCRILNEDRHPVTLTHGFEIKTTEVTQPQFETLMGYYPSVCESCPAEAVSWHEAAAYCNALSAKQNLAQCYVCSGSGETVSCSEDPRYNGPAVHACPGYRLPTEAEWEYACRAGATTAYPNGPNDPEACSTCEVKDENADAIAWYCANAYGFSKAVGVKQPNGWGLFDMAGNVWEWCHDWYQESLGAAPETDPRGPAAGEKRVVRGGAYSKYSQTVRAAIREFRPPAQRYPDVGFRCIRTTP